jgi:hypothetical protein
LGSLVATVTVARDRPITRFLCALIRPSDYISYSQRSCRPPNLFMHFSVPLFLSLRGRPLPLHARTHTGLQLRQPVRPSCACKAGREVSLRVYTLVMYILTVCVLYNGGHARKILPVEYLLLHVGPLAHKCVSPRNPN